MKILILEKLSHQNDNDIPCLLKTLLHSRHGYCELRSVAGGRTELFVEFVVAEFACNFSALMSRVKRQTDQNLKYSEE